MIKYRFINEDHKRMHRALIADGWTCKNDSIVTRKGGSNWEWVYYKSVKRIYFNCVSSCVYSVDEWDNKGIEDFEKKHFQRSQTLLKLN